MISSTQHRYPGEVAVKHQIVFELSLANGSPATAADGNPLFLRGTVIGIPQENQSFSFYLNKKEEIRLRLYDLRQDLGGFFRAKLATPIDNDWTPKMVTTLTDGSRFKLSQTFPANWSDAPDWY